MTAEFKVDDSNGRGLDNMTSHDHHRTMKTVRIAELKARLSEYLRLVRRGHPVIVMDRDTPIARIVPIEPRGGGLTVRMPKSSVPYWKIPLPPPYRGSVDIVEVLMEERQVDR